MLSSLFGFIIKFNEMSKYGQVLHPHPANYSLSGVSI